tara:strand:- start:322 stop:1185 length:864 start_codon:yes stop_codon:yes gene_type:complete
MSGQGTNLLGYGNDRVASAIAKEAGDGCSFSLSSTLEVEVGEAIKAMFPFVDCIRFFKGDDSALNAVMSIGRSRTGRMPTIVDPGELTHEELNLLRREANENSTFLVFDERVSGFRFPKYSAGNYYGIIPDLVILGGAIANGLPLFVVGGKFDAMKFDDTKNDSFFAGETLSLAAAKSTLHQLQTKYDLTWLWKQGEAFQDAFNKLGSGLRLVGYPTRLTLMGTPTATALFQQEAAKAGMLFGRETFMSFPLANEWKDAMEAIRGIVMKIMSNQVRLESELPKELCV